jgi:putative tricarboxylic transport membrane protein
MPFGLGMILFFLTFPAILHSLRERMAKSGKEEKENPWAGIDFGKIVLVMTTLILYYLFIERLGFLVTSCAAFIILFKFVAAQKWKWALVQTGLTLFVTYIFFIVLLEVYIPFFPPGLE